MLIKNLSADDMEIPDVGFVEAGGTIDVPDDIGKSLAEQTDRWEKSTAKKTTKGDS